MSNIDQDDLYEEEIMIKPEELKKSSLLNKFLKIVLPLALGIAILYFLFKDINIDELWSVLRDANWAILLFSLIFGLLGNTIRGYRWALLIKPLGYTPKVSNLNFAIYGGYAVNFVLPRAGEIWRCGVIAKEEKIPFTKLFGTMLIDRIFDTFTVLTITVIAFFCNMQFFMVQLEEKKESLNSVTKILTSPILYISILLVIVFIYIIFRFFRSNKIIMKIRDFMRSMWSDMVSIWRMKEKNKLLLYTVGIWGSYFLYFYITFFAFDFTRDLGITAGLIAFSLSSISMGVPSNGGIGPWHIAVVAALGLYGVDKLSAMAFATGVFTSQSLWVILCGLFGIAALAIRGKKSR